jgi:hypothetical protein
LAQRNVGGQASFGTLVPLAGAPVPLADILQILSTVLQQTQQGSSDGILLGVQQLLDQLSKTSGSATPVSTATSANDLTAILQQLANVIKNLNVAAPIAGTASAQQQADQLQKIVDTIKSSLTAGGQAQPLGQVNGALGQTIGNLLDGKKTAIGIIGALVTALLSNVPAGSGLADVLAKITPVAGFSGYMMPAFLALAAWGALGKLEKWAQGTAPPPTSPK